MTRITIDGDLASTLRTLTQSAELCDPSGKVLGRYTPLPDLSGRGPLEPQVSEEELDRRQRETGSLTTAEVLAYLENL
jgi:hypothetical protein